MKSELYRALVFLFVLLLIGTTPLIILGLTSWAVTVVIGFTISLIYIIFAYITIRHAFGKSTKIFYRYMIGGMAFRFTFFLLILFITYKMTGLPIIGFVLSFIVFYIVFQIIEARIVIREMKNQKIN